MCKETNLYARSILAEEIKRFDLQLQEHHYLGKADRIGDFLRQVVVDQRGDWIALLAWGPACYALKDRDQWMGWSNSMRAQRQKLVVQNRRFLLLSGKGHAPNLALRGLAPATKSLPEQWPQQFSYEPLLAETFTDEAFDGTCYKAAGWLPLGRSKGFARHRADFYQRHDRPKKIWGKPLHKTQALLCSTTLPEAQQAGMTSNAQGVLPLTQLQRRSLFEALQDLPDPRAGNTQFRMGTILSMITMALLSGLRDITPLHRFGQRLSQRQRGLIGCPRKRGTRDYKIPSYSVYYQVMKRLDLEAFSKALNRWLQEHSGSLPGGLAMDGKVIRATTIGVLSLVDPDTGVAYAMATTSSRKDEGDRCEQKIAQKLIDETAGLEGRLISADPLHTQRQTASIIVEKGADYLFGLKGNQPTVYNYAQGAIPPRAPLFLQKNLDMDD